MPPVPDISLSSITSNTILLYWKPPENYHSPLRQCIQINGITSKFPAQIEILCSNFCLVDEFEHSDGSVQLTGLQPGFYYGIRAIATNGAGNSTYSKMIQVQTTPKDGNRGVKLLSSTEPNVKRTISGRRVSYSVSSFEQAPVPSARESLGSNEGDSDETITKLTRKLDTLRRQKEEVETQLLQEIDDSENQRSSLTEERDILKRAVEEKDRASQELRRQVNDLEKQSKGAQRRRQAKEKALQQKKAERQKMRDDIERWIDDSIELQEKTESLKAQKLALEEIHAKKMDQVRDVIETTQAETKALEEEIREWGINIKHLEDNRKKADQEQGEEEGEADRREKEEEQRHEARVQDMQNQYALLWKMNADVCIPNRDPCPELIYCQADAQIVHEQEALSRMNDERVKELGGYGPMSGYDYTTAYAAQRRNRQASNRLSTSTFGSVTYPGPSVFNGISSMHNPLQTSAFPSFGPPSRAGTGFSSISQKDIDLLMAGTPMSPTANNLLPSDLLGDDDLPATTDRGDRPTLDSMEYGSSGFDPNSQDPQSPLSMHSASASLLSSPRDSFANTATFPGDADRQSIGSTGSPYTSNIPATSGASHDRRRAGLFNFNRNRPKSDAPDLPPLGSLKSSQSQSFPTNEQDTIGSAPGRRKLGSSVWSSPMANLLTRASSTAIESDAGPAPFPRKTRRGFFGSKLDPTEARDPTDRASSPRPSSTYSHEHGLPRPSSDSQPFGWGSQDTNRQRSSPLGSGAWPTAIGSNRSRNPSRRQSLQHGSTSNLSLGSTPLEPDDFQGTFGPLKPPQPAPIGTERFTISKDKERAIKAPKLNPAAPSFTARLFPKKTHKSEKFESGEPESSKSKSKTKEKDKDEDREEENAPTKKHAKDRDKEKERSQHPLHNPPSRSSNSDLLSLSDGKSHSSPRLSRDAYSIHTNDDSLHGDNALETSSSNTYSDLAPPSGSTPSSSSAPKESLMQRITRKSSSSKFSTAWRERSSIFSSSKKEKGEKGEPGTPVDVDEEAGEDYLAAKSGGTADESSTPGGDKENGGRSGRASLSWGRVISKKAKGKGGEKGRESSEVDRGEEDEQ